MGQAFGQFIKHMIGGRGRSVEAVAQEACIAPSTFRRWMSGRTEPNQQTLLIVLDNLNASSDEKAQAFALIDAPRSLSYFREQSEEVVSGLTVDLMPSVGELWRALRLRRGLTGKQVADAVRIHPSRVSRWEKSLSPTPEDLLTNLFDLLHARPEERDALSQHRILFVPQHRPLTVEDCEHQLMLLSEQTRSAKSFPGSLRFLMLESELWILIRDRPSVVEMLVATYAWHGDWLARNGRANEDDRCSRAAVRLIENAQDQPNDVWMKALSHCALHIARRTRNPDPAQGINLLMCWLNRVVDPFHKSTLNRDIAQLESERREFAAADFHIRQALQQAEDSDDPSLQKTGRFIHARSLLDRGGKHNAETVLKLVPEDEDGELEESLRVRCIVMRADAFARIGDRSSAADHLNLFYHLIDIYGYGHLKTEGRTVEELL